MITEWQIQSFSRKCAHSGLSFQPGDRVTCLLVESVSQGLIRVDVLEAHSEEIHVDGPIVGKWARIIKPPENAQSEEQKQHAQSVEELFVSMAESVAVEIRSNSTKCMIYILALFLERKKILKSIPTRGIPQNYINFRHNKTKEEYLVEAIEMTPENMAHIEKNLSILGGESPDADSETEGETAAQPVTTSAAEGEASPSS